MAYQPKTNDQDKAVADSLDRSSAGHAMLNPNMDIYASAQITEMMIPSMMQLGKIQQMRASQNQASRNIRSAVSDDAARVEADDVFRSTMGDLDNIADIHNPIEREREIRRIMESDPRRLSNPQVLTTMKGLRDNAREQTLSMANSLQRKTIEQKTEIFDQTHPAVTQNAIAESDFKLKQAQSVRDRWGADQVISEVTSKDDTHKQIAAAAAAGLPVKVADSLTRLTETIGGAEKDGGYLHIARLIGETSESAMRIDDAFYPVLRGMQASGQAYKSLGITDEMLLNPTSGQIEMIKNYEKSHPGSGPELIARKNLLETMALAKASRDRLNQELMGTPKLREDGSGLVELDSNNQPVLENGGMDRLSTLYRKGKSTGDMTEFKNESAVLTRKLRQLSEINRRQIENYIRDNAEKSEEIKIEKAIEDLRGVKARTKATTAKQQRDEAIIGLRQSGIQVQTARQLLQSALNNGDIPFPQGMKDGKEKANYIVESLNMMSADIDVDAGRPSQFD